MPIYDFECQECGRVSEIFRRDAEQVPRCFHCGSDKLKRMFTVSYMIKSGVQAPGTTCCGRAERCETPPCSTGGGCHRH